MTEFIGEIFSKIFNDNVVLATIFVSMVPIMELKGGIPFGMSEAFWGAKALRRWKAFWYAYLGCSMVVVCLYFAFVPIMKLLRKTKIFKGLANFIDNRVKKQSTKFEQDVNLNNKDLQNNTQVVTQNIKDSSNTSNVVIKKKLLKMLGVLTFVAIPLPLTGVWMGVCIAVMVGLNFWQTFISVQLGNLIAGIIISTICVIFPQFTHWLIYIFLLLVLIIVIIEIIKNKINKNKQKNN
ncbi:MAG: small multi-drug export protein [Clostridia bacterium]|nr:small multi-drug export protein [Clostridia bacterium]